jgi:hypothetical protein
VVDATLRPLYPRKRDLLPVVQEAGWAPGQVCTGPENPSSKGFDPRTVQAIASLYTDYTIPIHLICRKASIFNTRIRIFCWLCNMVFKGRLQVEEALKRTLLTSVLIEASLSNTLIQKAL